MMQQQKVTVPNKRGEKLVGVLHHTGSPDVVVLCHGFRSSKEDTTMKNLAVALQNEGTSAFRFDFAGNGESEGTFEFGRYQGEVEDLRAVVEHFTGHGRVVNVILGHSKENIGYLVSGLIMGLAYEFGKWRNTEVQEPVPDVADADGGGVVVLYASQYHDISTVVNLSGRFDLTKGISERLGEGVMEKLKQDGFLDVKHKSGIYRVTKESMNERLNTDMHQACLRISKSCRVLTVHGSIDEIIPVEDALEFAKIIPNHKLHIMEGADHCYTSHQSELASVVVNFMKETSQQDKGTSA